MFYVIFYFKNWLTICANHDKHCYMCRKDWLLVMGKWIAAVLVVAVLFVMLAACSQSNGELGSLDLSDEGTGLGEASGSDNETTPDTRPFDGTVITFMANGGLVHDTELEILAPRFTEETGIKVEFQIMTADLYPDLLMTRLSAGGVADIFTSQGGRHDIVSFLNAELNAVDLTGEEWVSRLDPLAAAEVSIDGKVFGQPIFNLSSVWAIAYNKQIFAALDLSIPSTFDEFMDVCQKISDAGIIPIYQAVADGWNHVIWFPEMGPIIEFNEPGITERLNCNQTAFAESPTAKLIVDQIKEMVDRGFWGEDYMSNRFGDAARYFSEGSYAMTLAHQWFPDTVNAFDPSFSPDDVGFFLIPLADNQILNVNMANPTRFIYSGSPNIEAAKLYFSFIARPENLQLLIDNEPAIWGLPFSGTTSSYTPTINEFFDRYPTSGTVFQTSVKYVSPQWMDIGAEIVNVIQNRYDSLTMLENIDRNRASQAIAAGDPFW